MPCRISGRKSPPVANPTCIGHGNAQVGRVNITFSQRKATRRDQPRPVAENMFGEEMKPLRKWRIVALLIGLLAVGWLSMSSVTIGSRIKSVFPGATPYVNRFNSDDVLYDDLLRLVIPSYFRVGEQMGLDLIDAPERLDLEAKFSELEGICFTGVKFVRCRIVRLPAEARGLMLFDSCDFSELPPEQRALLRAYDQGNPAYKDTFAYGTI
jgi:hypothetical protein